jgi:alkanesulfonate monooxygenase SsuD/methylene tetrahydromethanopterin reductase-like flavin-dependent oxidoreductase (luciferase family)
MVKIGFSLPDELSHVSLDQTLRLARRADEVGLHSVWKQEASGSNAFATLGAIAQATDGIKLGTGIVNVHSRSPTLLGMSAATLQQLSGGRALLGLGVSSAPIIEQWHGGEFDRPLRRMREAIEVIREVYTGGAVEYDGEIFDVGPYQMMLDTPGKVPIFNAAIGETNRRLTGEYADGWLPAFVPRSSFAEQVAEVRSSARKADRDPEDVMISPSVPVAVAADPTQAEKRVRYLLAQEMAVGYNEQVNEYEFGAAPDRAGELFESGRREEAMETVSQAMLDEFTIYGTKAEVRAQLQAYFEDGADMVLAHPSFNATVPEMERIVDALGEIASSE